MENPSTIDATLLSKDAGIFLAIYDNVWWVFKYESNVEKIGDIKLSIV